MTETESTTFIDCVRLLRYLLIFTNNKFASDVRHNARAFVPFFAAKLAEGGLACNEDNIDEILVT